MPAPKNTTPGFRRMKVHNASEKAYRDMMENLLGEELPEIPEGCEWTDNDDEDYDRD